MIDLTGHNSGGLLARRYAAERRFRFYGAAALGLTALFLLILLTDIAVKGFPAFFEHRVSLEVQINAEKYDAQNPKASDFQGMVKDAMREFFPEATSRADRKKIAALVSDAAAEELGALVLADPGLVGTKVRFDALLSADADLHLKGMTHSKNAAFIEQLETQGSVHRGFAWRFWLNGDSREPELAGLRGAIIGSLLTVITAILVGLPLGVGAAVYLEQFAPRNGWTDVIEVNINNLAAVPSIIFGLLGLAVFLNTFGLPRSTPVVGGLVLCLLVLPTIIIAARAALKAVPPSIKEAALAVGASEQQAVFHHVLPLALPGILTGTILALTRAFGETAPLLMIGMVAFIADVPGGFTDAATVLPVQIYLWSDLPELTFQSKTAAAIIVLVAVLMAFNALAIILRRRFERRW